MNILQLKTFVQVFKRRNLSRAAEDLHLTQPAVTLHLQKLEREFGSPLFQRQGARIVPTSCGEILYKHAQEILKRVENAKKEMSYECEGVSGALRVSASTTPGEFLVPQFVSGFIRRFPRVHTELFIMDSEAVFRCLQKQRCDFGFVGAIQKKQNFRFHKIAEDEIVLACPKHFKKGAGDAVSLKELEGETFVMREGGSGTLKSVRDFFRKSGFNFPSHHVAAVIESSHAQLSAIEAGLGIGFVSSFVLKGNTHKNIRVFRLKNIKLLRPLYMVYGKENLQSKLHGEFLNFVLCSAKHKGDLKT